MLPVLSVLINGNTVPNWANGLIVQSRLHVVLAADGGSLRVIRVKPGGAAENAHVEDGDLLAPKTSDPTPVLAALSDPAVSSITLHLTPDRAVTLTHLPPVPWYQALARDVVKKFPRNPVLSVAVVLAFGVCISFLGQVCRFFQEHYADKAAIQGINDLRRRLYDHILHIPMSFFSLKGTSDVTSRVIQDCNSLQDGFKGILGQSIQMPINAVMAFALALKVNWRLTLFIVLFAPVMWGIIRTFGKKMRRVNRRALQSSSVLLGQIEGSMLGIRVVKGHSAERFERRRFKRILAPLTAHLVRMSKIDTLSGPVVELSTLLIVCIIVLWATHLVLVTNELKPEQFLLVMACLATIADALRRFGKMNNILSRSGAAATRIFETLAIPVERPRHFPTRSDRPRINLSPISRDIRFENVTFRYAAIAAPAVQDATLTVKKGESVAVVGRNGSGKTTLAALLPRFYDPQSGRLLIDGIDIRQVTLRSLRDQITIVTQDSVIFPGTIAQNIAYGHPDAMRLDEDSPASRNLRQQIEAAARRAFAHDFILEKPLGYDSILGELGGSLSGGQKQRINIARAIFRSTPILILDEATSQVDAESEALIQKAIESLLHERTTFVIAHRLGTILSSDRIIVMDRGRIVAEGKHDDLLQTCETYANLYERQLIVRAAAPVSAV